MKQRLINIIVLLIVLLFEAGAVVLLARTRPSKAVLPLAAGFTIAPATWRYQTTVTLRNVTVPDGVQLIAIGEDRTFTCVVHAGTCSFDVSLPLRANTDYALYIYRGDSSTPPWIINWSNQLPF